MKTVVENNTGLDKNFSPVRLEYHVDEEFRHGKSCFYDFGSKSFLQFSGFTKDGDSDFIRSVGKMFHY